MPGIGVTPGAEFIAATGGDMAAFGSPNRLADVAPVPRDSGKVPGNLRRPRRCSRRLLRMFYAGVTASCRAIGCRPPPVARTATAGHHANDCGERQPVFRRLAGLPALPG
ncbi:hypothetical protein GCM10010349_79460 [Streptomyces flavofungini]|nr:hypothetical protein GCM10010349_79460 [Streptomyces flavofungini]